MLSNESSSFLDPTLVPSAHDPRAAAQEKAAPHPAVAHALLPIPESGMERTPGTAAEVGPALRRPTVAATTKAISVVSKLDGGAQWLPDPKKGLSRLAREPVAV